MTNSIPDPERLASLLDGRLNEAERAELVDLLASSDDAFEAYIDAVAITQEMEQLGEQPGVLPLQPPQRTRGRLWTGSRRWLAVAAVVAAVALIPLVMNRHGAPDLRDPGHFVTLLEAKRAGLPPGWNDRPWGTTRGAGDPLATRARAVRVGARLTDLELAVQARDSAATTLLAAEIEALLEEVPASGPLAALYRDVGRRAGQSPDQLDSLLEQGRGSVAQILGEDLVALGAWTEAARVAAARRDRGFFRSRATNAVLDRAMTLASLNQQARRSVEQIHSAIRTESAPNWVALEAELLGLLRMLGS